MRVPILLTLCLTLCLSLGCGSSESDVDTGVDDVVADVMADTEGDPAVGDAAETDEDAPDVAVEDASEDPLEDTPVDAAPLACGAATCAPSEVCVVRCLCCGIDTGNPADQRSEYICVEPPAGCTDRPSTCALSTPEGAGCMEDGDRTLACPCA